MQIRCNFPDISYLSETQKNKFQFINYLIVSLAFVCFIAENSSCNGPVEIDMDPISQYRVSEIVDSSFNGVN